MHSYFDVCLENRILTANVSLEDGALIVEFDVDDGVEMPDDVRSKLTYHLRRFDLNTRYAREVNVYLTGHTIGLGVVYNVGGAAAVQEYLQSQRNVEAGSFYINHWRPVLLSALWSTTVSAQEVSKMYYRVRNHLS